MRSPIYSVSTVTHRTVQYSTVLVVLLRTTALPIDFLPVLFGFAALLFEFLVAGLGGPGDTRALPSYLGSRPGLQDHGPELVDGLGSVASLGPVFLRGNGQDALLGDAVGVLLPEPVLDFPGHPGRVLFVEQVDAELDLGAQLVDVLAAGSGGSDKGEFQLVFRDADVFWNRPGRRRSWAGAVVAAVLFSFVVVFVVVFGIVRDVFPRRFDIVVVVVGIAAGRRR
mmetsp:Transcript_18488/g.38535  ORF Transcript_18488/g.38535 Transcript_18488/m.38535 type:complete len:225 (+) Transcript_18488:224-898(+)